MRIQRKYRLQKSLGDTAGTCQLTAIMSAMELPV